MEELRNNSGKTKSIGGISLAYCDLLNGGNLAGKLAGIGPCALRHRDVFSSGNLAGKIKSIGMVQLEYYDSYQRTRESAVLKLIRKNTERLRICSPQTPKDYRWRRFRSEF